jgi:class 3 adenylate cyclase/TolB-like protein
MVRAREDNLDQLRHLAGQFAWANRTVLFIDIVESVRLVEDDEVSVVARWLALVGKIKTALPAYQGRFVKGLGDGMLLDFEEARTAAAAAFEIQRMSEVESFPYPPEQRIQLRIGMEVSDVILIEGDVHGHGVNLASRLASLAGPGEIVCSQHVRDQIISTLDAEIEDLGDCFLRHVKQPVRAYRIGPPGSYPQIKSIISLEDLAPAVAVIPFAPRGAGSNQAVIGEVLAEEIIRALSRSPDLNLVSRLSTTAFRGRAAALGKIATRLHADYVVSGWYADDEESVTIEVELAETGAGRILWSERVTENISAMLGGEQEMIGRLVEGICASVMTREIRRARLQPLPTLKAYTLLLGAIALMHRLSPRDFEDAKRLLQALTDRGVRQPTALAWMANWHVLRVQQGWSDDLQRDAKSALEYTKRALDADPDCSLALAIAGFVHANLLKKLDAAKDCYEQAIATNPSESLAWLLKGALHAFMSEGRQAVEHAQRALKLSPLDPRHYFYDSLAASACLADHQNELALKLAQRSLRANRKHTSTWRVLTVAQWNLGLHDDARASVAELLKLEPHFTVDGWLKRHPAAAFPIGREISEVLRQAGVPN